MKWVLYTLLLLNLAMALWHYQLKGSQQELEIEESDNTLHLVLLREYLESQENTDQTQITEAATARCYTLGPFKSKKLAKQTNEELKVQGIEAKQRVSKDNSRPGYWVMIPAEKTRKEAKLHIARLKEQGVKDYFLVATGEHKNAVSLGVFSKPDLAQRRFKEMQKLGFATRVEKVKLPLREYWLDWPEEQVLAPDVLEKLRKEHRGLGQAQKACEANNS